MILPSDSPSYPYGTRHRRQRDYYAKIVAAGHGFCEYCGKMVPPGEDFHLAHDHGDQDGLTYTGISCVRCNVKEARRRNARGKRPASQKSADQDGGTVPPSFAEPIDRTKGYQLSSPESLQPDGSVWSRRWLTDGSVIRGR